MEDNPHYVTPDEAIQKYCVFPVFNGHIQKACTGTACMAWRWRPKGHQDLMQGAMLQLPLVPEKSMTHGYCGMVRS